MSAAHPLQHVLVTTDLSPASQPALVAGASLARVLSARLTLLHVLNAGSLAGSSPMRTGVERLKTEWRDEMTLRVERLGKQFLDGMPHEVALVEASSVADGICRFARENGAHILVIATNGRTGVRRWLLGSVAERVLQMAPCSVLVVRSDGALHLAAEIQRILVPTDLSECSAPALEYAVEIARCHGAEIDLLHSYETAVPLGLAAVSSLPRTASPESERVRSGAELLLENVKIKVEAHGVRAQKFLSPEMTVPAILHTAARRRSDLIVMGTYVRSGLHRLLAGSILEPVVRRSPCPVLTVSPPSPAHERSPAANLTSRPIP